MKRLLLVSIAAVAAFAVSVGSRDARADTAEDRPQASPEAPAAELATSPELAPSCEVDGVTLAQARHARASRHEILWNPVEEAELIRHEDLLELKLAGAGGVLRGERAYALTELELRPRTGSSRYPLEARFIHENAVGDQVVVGLFIAEGAENPAVEPLRAAAEHADGAELAGLDLRTLLPAADAHLRLAARTAPDCAPRIVWTVLDEPIEASREQLAALSPASRS